MDSYTDRKLESEAEAGALRFLASAIVDMSGTIGIPLRREDTGGGFSALMLSTPDGGVMAITDDDGHVPMLPWVDCEGILRGTEEIIVAWYRDETDMYGGDPVTDVQVPWSCVAHEMSTAWFAAVQRSAVTKTEFTPSGIAIKTTRNGYGEVIRVVVGDSEILSNTERGI